MDASVSHLKVPLAIAWSTYSSRNRKGRPSSPILISSSPSNAPLEPQPLENHKAYRPPVQHSRALKRAGCSSSPNTPPSAQPTKRRRRSDTPDTPAKNTRERSFLVPSRPLPLSNAINAIRAPRPPHTDRGALLPTRSPLVTAYQSPHTCTYTTRIFLGRGTSAADSGCPDSMSTPPLHPIATERPKPTSCDNASTAPPASRRGLERPVPAVSSFHHHDQKSRARVTSPTTDLDRPVCPSAVRANFPEESLTCLRASGIWEMGQSSHAAVACNLSQPLATCNSSPYQSQRTSNFFKHATGAPKQPPTATRQLDPVQAPRRQSPSTSSPPPSSPLSSICSPTTDFNKRSGLALLSSPSHRSPSNSQIDSSHLYT